MSKSAAIKSERVLLLNLGLSDKVRTTLAEILSPYFRLEATDFHSGCADQVSLSDDNLSGLILRHKPAMIFLATAANLKTQTRHLLELVRKDFSAIPAMVLTEVDDPDEMLAWLKLGAADFLTLPLRAIDVLPRVWRLKKPDNLENPPLEPDAAKSGLNELVGENQKFLKEIEKIPAIAKCDASVLI